MSIQNILVPNNYDLFCNTINGKNVVVAGDIVYHTLTQDNALSHVDASGNAKLGNCQAAVIDCTNVVASTGITAGLLGVDTTGPMHCSDLTSDGNITSTNGDLLFGSTTPALIYQHTNGEFSITGTDPNSYLDFIPNTTQGCQLINTPFKVADITGVDGLTFDPSTNKLTISSSSTGTSLEYTPSSGPFPGILLLQTQTGVPGAYNKGAVICNSLASLISGIGCNLLQLAASTHSSDFTTDLLTNLSERFYICNAGVTAITLQNVTNFTSFCTNLGFSDASRLYVTMTIINSTGGTITINNSADGKVVSHTASVPNNTNLITYKFLIIDPTGAATPSVILY